jgi:hypothetical protein
MAGEILIRRISLAGWTFDTDWTNPANSPPDNARRLKFTSTTVQLALVGKSGIEDAATQVDVGTLTVNAWLGMEVAGAIIRGQTIVETVSSELGTRIKIISTDVTPGAYGRFNIVNLTNIGGLPALWVYLISGARPA